MSEQHERQRWLDEAFDRSNGLHFNGQKRLGWIPRDQTKAIITFGGHLLETDDFALEAPVIPTHPIVDTWPVPNMVWPMDHNDEAGDCVVAGVDHALQAIATLLGIPRTNWTDAQILKYYQTQNPGFKSWADSGGPNDNGMVIQDFLAYLVKEGTILGFALVDHTNEDEMKAAAYLGLANVTGETLDIAQQSQTTWDYVKRSPVWGGHCTATVAYGDTAGKVSDLFKIVTWGSTVEGTDAFFRQQVSEVYFIVTADLVAHPSFRQQYDMASFAAAYTAITGRPFPVVAPPTPVPPTPPTPPAPGGDDASFLAAYQSYAVQRDSLVGQLETLNRGFDQVVQAWAASKNLRAD